MTDPRRARTATTAAFAAQGLAFSVLLTHLPEFTDVYRLSQGAVTLVVLAVVVLAGVGSVLTERLAAATSSRLALRVGLFGVAATTALVALAPGGVVAFLAGFALYGIALGTVDAAGNMQGVAVQHAYGRSIIASFHAAWSAAAIAGALFVACGEHVGVPLAPSVLVAAVAVLLVALVAGPRLLAGGRPAGRPDAAGDGPHAASADRADVPAPGRRRGPSTALVLLGAAMACFWAVDSSVSDWSALYLDELGAAGSTAALGYALYQATGLLSRLLGDPAVRRFGATRTVRAGAAVGTVGAAGRGARARARGRRRRLRARRARAARARPAVLLGRRRRRPPRRRPAAAASADDAVNRVVARLNVFNYVGALVGAVLVGVVATVSDLRLGFVLPVLLAGALVGLAPAFDARAGRPVGRRGQEGSRSLSGTSGSARRSGSTTAPDPISALMSSVTSQTLTFMPATTRPSRVQNAISSRPSTSPRTTRSSCSGSAKPVYSIPRSYWSE